MYSHRFHRRTRFVNRRRSCGDPRDFRRRGSVALPRPMIVSPELLLVSAAFLTLLACWILFGHL